MTKKEYREKVINVMTNTPQTISEISIKSGVKPQIVGYFIRTEKDIIKSKPIKKGNFWINHYFL